MLPLMKFTFCEEYETKKKLADFILSTNKLSMDVKCFEFEKEFAKLQDSKDAVLFNSGGSANLALLQTLKNLGRIKDGAKVGFSAITWSTNVMPIIQLNLEPVPIDCDVNTLNVMSHNLEEVIKNVKLDIFFATNVLGFAGDLDAIRNLCEQNNIIFIEDNCEALGTEIGGKKSGTFGEAATFSFFVAHHMSTIEGGMVCTNDGEIAQMLRIVRANGWDRNLSFEQQKKIRKHHNIKSEFYAKYTFYDLGFNLRPTEITGFLGLQQLKYLKDTVNTREKNYLAVEKIIESNDELISIKHDHISKLSNFSIPVVAKNFELFEKYYRQFSGAGIEIRPMIAGNIQKQPFYKKYVYNECILGGADFIHECGFYCGNYPEMTENDLDLIKSCLSE